MTVTTAVFAQPEVTSGPVTALLPGLLRAHMDAAEAASRLDPADQPLWATADRLVAQISAEAYRIKAAVHGTPPIRTASRLTPVVRLRELSAAQRGLTGAMESVRPGQRIATDVQRSTEQVRTLAGLLNALVTMAAA